MMKIKYTFIVIGYSKENCEEALKALGELDYNKDEYEVLISTGNNPSNQRNKASLEAKGEFLIFLDNDSKADPSLLKYYDDALTYSDNIGVIGGPAIYEAKTNKLQISIQSVLTSVFGLGPSKSRYTPLGIVRKTSQKELILCNLCFKKEVFQREGGLNTKLYPNEENELLNKVEKSNDILYHPLCVVWRAPRKTILAFISQMFNYGAGRSLHYLYNPSFIEVVYMMPAIFSLYVISLPILAYFNFFLFKFYILPFVIYLLLATAASFFSFMVFRVPAMLFYMPLLFFLCHFFYGAGIILWFFQYAKKKKNKDHDFITKVEKYSF